MTEYDAQPEAPDEDPRIRLVTRIVHLETVEREAQINAKEAAAKAAKIREELNNVRAKLYDSLGVSSNDGAPARTVLSDGTPW